MGRVAKVVQPCHVKLFRGRDALVEEVVVDTLVGWRDLLERGHLPRQVALPPAAVDGLPIIDVVHLEWQLRPELALAEGTPETWVGGRVPPALAGFEGDQELRRVEEGERQNEQLQGGNGPVRAVGAGLCLVQLHGGGTRLRRETGCARHKPAS